MKAILFGCGDKAKRLYREIAEKYDVVAIASNEGYKSKNPFGVPIYLPAECFSKISYDVVIMMADIGFEEIYQQCIELGVDREKIITSYIDWTQIQSKKARETFLRTASILLNEYGQEADVAEVGVYRGVFAAHINSCFPNRTLHLFDTFEGFSEIDIAIELEQSYSQSKAERFNQTSVELVMKRMPHPECCKIYKGYFPETAVGVNSRFCFVNLDLDLYQPTYNGLHFFKNKMTDTGMILVHDYFSEEFKGVKHAVNQFLAECNCGIGKYPIGDGCSILLAGCWSEV